ncbi:hypothetical protein COOONC_21578 [Cooperia oncophora]
MAMYDMKELPHLVKPVTLILIILQTIFVFAPGYRSFGWFVIMTTIIEGEDKKKIDILIAIILPFFQLIVCVLVFACIGFNITGLLNMPMWPMAEMTYSGVFVIFQVINFFYFIVNMFKHFNVFFLFGMAEAAFLALVWLFDAYQWWRARTPAAAATTGNQATAAPPPNFPPNYPAGVNPA